MLSTSEEHTLRVNDILHDSIADGPGLRFVVFFQGCHRRCPGCHNPQTHDPRGGRLVSLSELTRAMSGNPMLRGLTLSGGEPFLQAAAAARLASEARALGLDVWCYTGMTWEELNAPGAPPEWRELLERIDVLADGPFILQRRSLELEWRGSCNQRLIDVKASINGGEMVEYYSKG